jgi:hypothetical protein
MIPFLTALSTIAAFVLMGGGIYCAVCQLVLALHSACATHEQNPAVSALRVGIANAFQKGE